VRGDPLRRGGPQGPPGLRLRTARRRRAENTHREAPKRVSSVQGNPMGASDLLQIRRSRTGQTPERRTRRGNAARDDARGGWRRRRSLRRDVMKCSEGERPGAPMRSSADERTRAHEPRAIRRRGVSLLLFLRAGGAETRAARDREVGSAATRGRRLGARRSPGSAPGNPMDGSGPRGREAERGGTRRGGGKPRGRNEPGRQSREQRTRPHRSSEGTETPGGEGRDREVPARNRGRAP
jgi:hypothetical protein